MRRFVPGLLMGGGWLLLLFYGSYLLFWLVITGLGAVALSEYLRMSVRERQPTEEKVARWSIVTGLFPVLAAYYGQIDAVAAGMFIALLSLVVLTLSQYRSVVNGFAFMARLGFGFFYIGFCLAHVVLIRALPQGVFWLLLLTALTVSSDTCAYYTGRWLGRNKLCPSISPGKTREGALGGLLGGIGVALGTAACLSPGIDLLKVALLALLLTCVGIIGDLTESVIKRFGGVKDSGQLLAGHGGVLDRGDSFLLTAPVLFYLLHFGWLAVF